MQISSSQGGHSSRVEMHLVLNGEAHRVAQLGPDFLMLETPVDHPPVEAEFVFSVDDNCRRWTVRLPDGISRNSIRAKLSAGQTKDVSAHAIS
jgi:hypothetical protein